MKDSWYLLNIVNDYFTKEVRTYISNLYQQTSTYSSQDLDYLSTCELYFGDDQGSSIQNEFQTNNYLSIREFKIWNEAKSYEDLIYNSIQPLYKKSTNFANLAVYYKFVSQNSLFYDLVYFPMYYIDITVIDAGIMGIATWTTGAEEFMMDCSPGMSGSVSSGCMPFQNWLSTNPETPLNTAVSYDIGQVIKERVMHKDVELTVSVMSAMLTEDLSYQIIEIEKLISVKRVE